jgi:hypothetical protein
MMTNDFLIQPFSQEASTFLAGLNQDMQRQEAMELGQPFVHHASSLDIQIRVHHMTAAQRLSLIEELKAVFYRYVQQPDKSLAHVAVNYLNILAYGTLNATDNQRCLAPDLVQDIQRIYQERVSLLSDAPLALAAS